MSSSEKSKWAVRTEDTLQWPWFTGRIQRYNARPRSSVAGGSRSASVETGGVGWASEGLVIGEAIKRSVDIPTRNHTTSHIETP
nr:hypothetical protein CFP56_11233 [Quercus suber]